MSVLSHGLAPRERGQEEAVYVRDALHNVRAGDRLDHPIARTGLFFFSRKRAEDHVGKGSCAFRMASSANTGT